MVPLALNRRPVLKHLTADTPLGNVLVPDRFRTPENVPINLGPPNPRPLPRTLRMELDYLHSVSYRPNLYTVKESPPSLTVSGAMLSVPSPLITRTNLLHAALLPGHLILVPLNNLPPQKTFRMPSRHGSLHRILELLRNVPLELPKVPPIPGPRPRKLPRLNRILDLPKLAIRSFLI